MAKESTTPDLVELVRFTFEAANRRDFDAILDVYAPEAIWLGQITLDPQTFGRLTQIPDRSDGLLSAKRS